MSKKSGNPYGIKKDPILESDDEWDWYIYFCRLMTTSELFLVTATVLAGAGCNGKSSPSVPPHVRHA